MNVECSGKWLKTNGKEPNDFGDTSHVFLFSVSGEISLNEAFGCVEWTDFTHYMLVDIEYPQRP